MRQLSGVDALHIIEETERQHMHTIKVALLGDRPDGGPVTVDEVRDWANKRLPQIAPMRWRVHKIPLGLGRPVFVDDGPIDVDDLIVEAEVRSPGGDAELNELVARVASVQLPRHKPLWQLTIVTGLASGNLGLIFKIHHAIMDGQASVRFFEQAFDLADAQSNPAEAPLVAEAVPSKVELVKFAMAEHAKLYGRLPHVVKRTFDSISHNRGLKQSGAPQVVNPLSGPMTRFNKWPETDRVYTDVTIPFSEIRAMKATTGSTVNELFVTLCGGAIRRYLSDIGELPDRGLNSASPVSLRKPEEMDDYGNRTSYWYVSLGTEYDDPVERIKHVKNSLDAAKAWAQGDVELFAVWQDYYFLFGMMTLKLLTAMEKLTGRPAFNAVVSNVKGPEPLTLCGAPVDAVRSMGPITRSLGLNFTVWTYRDNFSIGIHSCRAFIDDITRLGDYVREELESMKEAFGSAD